MTTEKARDAYLKRTYDISLEEYMRILAFQGHKCMICEKPLEGFSNPVDHDHASKIVRGVCCRYCNRYVIGRNRDWRVMQRVSDYLRNPPAVRAIGERKVPKKKPRKKTLRTRTPRSTLP